MVRNAKKIQQQYKQNALFKMQEKSRRNRK